MFQVGGLTVANKDIAIYVLDPTTELEKPKARQARARTEYGSDPVATRLMGLDSCLAGSSHSVKSAKNVERGQVSADKLN